MKRMRRAREAGLKALDPSAKNLEHGLELHARSLVFDVYGFAPRAALDPEALREAEEAGASERELNDLREEMGMTRCVSDPAQRARLQGRLAGRRGDLHFSERG